MILNVKEYVAERKKELAETIGDLNRPPRLLIIQLGNDNRSNAYIKGKLKDAAELGIIADVYSFMRVDEIINYLGAINRLRFYDSYDGIIIEDSLGMTKEEKDRIKAVLLPDQDIDGFLEDSHYQPCTPTGIIKLIDKFYGISLCR